MPLTTNAPLHEISVVPIVLVGGESTRSMLLWIAERRGPITLDDVRDMHRDDLSGMGSRARELAAAQFSREKLGAQFVETLEAVNAS